MAGGDVFHLQEITALVTQRAGDRGLQWPRCLEDQDGLQRGEISVAQTSRAGHCTVTAATLSLVPRQQSQDLLVTRESRSQGRRGRGCHREVTATALPLMQREAAPGVGWVAAEATSLLLWAPSGPFPSTPFLPLPPSIP